MAKKRAWYTTAEVAAAIGVTRQTIQAWLKVGKIDAPVRVIEGRATRAWSEAQKESARLLKGTLKPGPKHGRRRTRGGRKKK